MRIITIILFLEVIFLIGIKAQRYKYLPPKTKEIIVNYTDSFARINILIIREKVKIRDDVFYYWYYSNTINKNSGGYQGSLLDGDYSLFSKENHLIAQGFFNKGQKDKTWKYWYGNGCLKETQNWEKGKIHGQNVLYDTNGNKLSEKKYKNGLLHGSYIVYKDGKRISERRFRRGREIQRDHLPDAKTVDSASVSNISNVSKSKESKLFTKKASLDTTSKVKTISSKKFNDQELKSKEPQKQTGLRLKWFKKGKGKAGEEQLSLKKRDEKVKEIKANKIKESNKKESRSFWERLFKKKKNSENAKTIDTNKTTPKK